MSSTAKKMQSLALLGLSAMLGFTPALPAARAAGLTPDDLERLQKLIKPHADEWQYARVPWVATIAEARQKAAKEGKPLFIWYMVGEPLGQC